MLLQQANRTLPVVFVTISDPVSGGFVESMSLRAVMRPALAYLNGA